MCGVLIAKIKGNESCISYGKRVIIVKFTYYVLNYNHNAQKVEPFNIFNNVWVQKLTEKEIKKYLRSPKNYKYESFFDKKDIIYYSG